MSRIGINPEFETESMISFFKNFSVGDSLKISRKYLTSLSLFVEKKRSEIPQRTFCLEKNIKIPKMFNMCLEFYINTWKLRRNPWFRVFNNFSVGDSLEISRKNFTILRLFAQEKSLQSRRAARASTKTSKIQNS